MSFNKDLINELYSLTLTSIDQLKIDADEKRKIAKGLLGDFHYWIYYVVGKYKYEQVDQFKNPQELVVQSLVDSLGQKGQLDVVVSQENYRLVLETPMNCLIRSNASDAKWLASAGIKVTAQSFAYNAFIDDFTKKYLSFVFANKQKAGNVYSSLLTQPNSTSVLGQLLTAFQSYSSSDIAMSEQQSRATATSRGFSSHTNLSTNLHKLSTSTNAGWQPRVDWLINFPSQPSVAQGRSSSAPKSRMNVKYGAGKYIIFTGPPGTGKSRKAGRYVHDSLAIKIEKELGLPKGTVTGEWQDKDRPTILRAYRRYECTTQFHQSYGYEDFIEGIRPFTDKEGKLSYKICDGVFTAIWRKATETWAKIPVEWESGTSYRVHDYFINLYDLDAEDSIEVQVNGLHMGGKINSGLLVIDPASWDTSQDLILKGLRELEVIGESWSCNNEYFLIADEINRAKVSKVFGELLFALGSSDNTNLEVKTQYSKMPLIMAQNLHIIGTMNSCDKSIDRLDQALKRRFHFVELMPFTQFETEPSWLSLNDDFRKISGVEIGKFLDGLNAALLESSDFEYDRQIGHSFFYSAHTHWKRLTKNNIQSDHGGDIALFVLFEVYFSKIFPVLQEFFSDDRDGLEKVCPKDLLDKNSRSMSLAAEVSRILADSVMNGSEAGLKAWKPLQGKFKKFLVEIAGTQVPGIEESNERKANGSN